MEITRSIITYLALFAGSLSLLIAFEQLIVKNGLLYRLYYAASMIFHGKSAYKEVCMAKNFATDVCDRVVHDAVQIHGGYGYCKEFLVERIYRDSRLLSICLLYTSDAADE